MSIGILNRLLTMPTAELAGRLTRSAHQSGWEWYLFLPRFWGARADRVIDRVVLVAHIDCVRDPQPTDKLVWSRGVDGRLSASRVDGTGAQAILSADDRAGVYAAMRIYRELAGMEYQPAVLLCDGEESSKTGAHEAAEALGKEFGEEALCLTELDRRNAWEAVFYNLEPDSFRERILSFGFAERIGSGTDISVLGPVFGVCAVNLSVGYKFAHSEKETLWLDDLLKSVVGTWEIVKQLTQDGTRWVLERDCDDVWGENEI